jgi:hypothetical protein
MHLTRRATRRSRSSRRLRRRAVATGAPCRSCGRRCAGSEPEGRASCRPSVLWTSDTWRRGSRNQIDELRFERSGRRKRGREFGRHWLICILSVRQWAIERAQHRVRSVVVPAHAGPDAHHVCESSPRPTGGDCDQPVRCRSCRSGPATSREELKAVTASAARPGASSSGCSFSDGRIARMRPASAGKNRQESVRAPETQWHLDDARASIGAGLLDGRGEEIAFRGCGSCFFATGDRCRVAVGWLAVHAPGEPGGT